MSYSLNIKGIDEVKKKIDPSIYKPKLNQTMRQVVGHIQGYVQTQKLSGQVLKTQSGRLKDSIQAVIEEGNNYLTGKVGTNLVYARIHEVGGIIRAKNAPYLKFQVEGKWVSKKEVRIPARPYMKPSLEENRSFTIERFQKAIDEILEINN